MTAVVLPFPAPDAPPLAVRTGGLNVGCQTAQEAILAAQLLSACAPPSLDRLEAWPAVRERPGQPPLPVVIVEDRGLHIIAAADTLRRIAVSLDQWGRQGAALDLLRACDQAEALAAHLQHRSMH